ncbi:hypothetical protein O181_033257 [Austropuccinia psidii MF-1]|uniref:Uncharacterized protein n=1 Tax=Austropuccinia psidii MF-1 TaxID=1389203 RepID=A0A9Q3H6Z9_9BASI|nr:hypothetical protein [Austropuccinia psidii MF-1]
MSDSMYNMQILRKFGGELEDYIKCRCIEPCSTEDYINSMEDIITRARTGKTWTRTPIESRIVPKNPMEEKISDIPVLKFHRCGSTSHMANNCTNKTKINEVKITEEVQVSEDKVESDQDSKISDDTPVHED